MNGKMRALYDGEPAPAAPSAPAAPAAQTLVAPQSAPAAPSAPAEPATSEFKLPDGWDYRTALPENLRTGVAAKYASLADLVTGAENAQKLIGKPIERLVEIPPNADPETRRGVLSKLGLPEKIEDYKVSAPKKGGDFVDVSKPAFAKLREAAHGLGILPDQLQGLVEVIGESTQAGYDATVAAGNEKHATNIKALQTELGETFDKTVADANLGIMRIGGQELVDAINGAQMGTDPVVLKAFAKVGAMLAEDGGGGDKDGGGDGPLNPSQIRGQATDLIQQAIDEKNPVKRRELEAKAAKLFSRLEGNKKV